MGAVLIAGTASLLICIFLSPKFIAFLRAREFGQNIREEGPEGHHEKAGTPTMGGIIIFTAIAVPFLILSRHDWQALGVFGVGDRVRAGRLRRRLHEDRQAPLARACARARSCSSTIAISIGLWWVATEEAGLPTTLRLRVVDAQIDLRDLLSRPHLPRRRRHDERR